MKLWLTGGSSSVFLLQQLHGITLTLPTLSIYLCSDFPPGFTLLSHWPKQLYSSTNKSNTCTEGHPTSSPGGMFSFIKVVMIMVSLHSKNPKTAFLIPCFSTSYISYNILYCLFLSWSVSPQQGIRYLVCLFIKHSFLTPEIAYGIFNT